MKKLLGSMLLLTLVCSCTKTMVSTNANLTQVFRSNSSNNLKYTKEGRECRSFGLHEIFGFNYDFSVASIAKNNNITEIVSVDQETSNNIISAKYCLIVRGN